MSRAIIEVENVSKRYKLGQFNARTLRDEAEQFFRRLRRKNKAVGVPHALAESSEFWALKDVSFSVQRGEVLGIIGRNGAGKSTLLKILSRVTEPTSGEIRIRGRVASLLEVGTGFHPELTGRENIYLNGTILGMTKAEVKAKFEEIVAFAEIGKFLDTPVKRYSSGMYVRLAFAVAAHLEPEILIVDEVLAVGDAEFQKRCLRRMREVSGKDGRTVLFVSHNLAAIEALTHRAVLLRDGAIQFLGPTRACLETYLQVTADRRARVSSRLTEGRYTRVLSVDVLDEGGLPTCNYSSDNPLVLEVAIQTDGVKGMSFDIYISNSLGHRVYFYTSNLFDEIDIPASRGCYQFRLTFRPLMLASGNYSVDVATALTNIGYDDHVVEAATFQVHYFNPTGRSWDFRELDGYGSVAMTLDATVLMDRTEGGKGEELERRRRIGSELRI